MSFLQYLPLENRNELLAQKNANKFPFNDYYNDAEIKQLEEIIGMQISNIAFFEQAFTHRSYLQVLKNFKLNAYSNERLEFLGDAILELIMSDYLFNFYPDENEGYLSRVRAQFVNKHTLAKVANDIKLFDFIKVSFATERDEKHNEKMMSNIYESVLAAVFLDAGIEAAIRFVYKTLIPLFKINDFLVDRNYKSILMEIIQSQGKSPPEYQVLAAIGPDHQKEYTIGVYSENILIGIGKGNNKKNAEQNACQNALENI